jgi:FixJ family two-component response regulator
VSILTQNEVVVVITEAKLPDGDWRKLKERLNDLHPRTSLVVTSVLADDILWAAVLNEGGFDVLAKPFCGVELFFTLSAAWRHWDDQNKIKTMSATS